VLVLNYRDNLNTDIFGANLYHRYLTRQRSGRAVSGIAAAVTGRGNHNCELEIETEDVHASAEECHSILVQVNTFLMFSFVQYLKRECFCFLFMTDWRL
jgi:hypothetical protein